MTTEHRLRQDAIAIFMAALSAVDPEKAILDHLSLKGNTILAGDEHIELHPEGRVLLVGAGKAAAPMAAAVEQVLEDRISVGIVAVKYGHLFPVTSTVILEAGHPVPDEKGLEASLRILELADGASEKDLVICLLSGGGSAILPCPRDPVTLEDKGETTGLLMASGASIEEINIVRKHLSLIKGGGLARVVYPARLLTLIMSDVVGDPLDVIASGPTVPDPSTFQEAMEVLNRYEMRERVPGTVLDLLIQGVNGAIPETLKEDSEELAGTFNILVGNNDMALAEAHRKATSLGYNTSILPYPVTGEARDAAIDHVDKIRDIHSVGYPLHPPACLISGGETTVTIRGMGMGGRNQEFALAAIPGLDGLNGVVVLSAGTDGIDGPTDAAGAIVDGHTAGRARELGLAPDEYLANNDAYGFFSATGDLFITGPTLTNVMDLQIVLVSSQDRS